MIEYDELIPLFERDGFIICFTAEREEDVTARQYFIQQCGWTAAQFHKIADCYWFSAKVSAWRGGVELGAAYLGCCCYETIEEFFAKPDAEDMYFKQMMEGAIAEAKRRVVTPVAGQSSLGSRVSPTGQQVGDTASLVDTGLRSRWLKTL